MDIGRYAVENNYSCIAWILVGIQYNTNKVVLHGYVVGMQYNTVQLSCPRDEMYSAAVKPSKTQNINIIDCIRRQFWADK